MHIFAENALVKRHNDNRLKHIPGKIIKIPAKDEVPKNSKISDVRKAQNRKVSETGGLASMLELILMLQKIYFNSCGERHQNLAFCLRGNIIFLKHDTFPGISVIDITKNSFSYDIIRIMLVYCGPNSSLTSFYNTLEYFLRCYCIDIVLGDFNINTLNGENINLQDISSNYISLVNEPTHISGSMIDHVYVYNKSLQKFLPSKIEVLSIYFSDHDTVKFRLQ